MAKIENYDSGVVDGNSRFIGTAHDGSNTTTNYTADAVETYLLSKKTSVPASAGAPGTGGDYAVESGYAYFCVADNTWERVAIATW